MSEEDKKPSMPLSVDEMIGLIGTCIRDRDEIRSHILEQKKSLERNEYTMRRLDNQISERKASLKKLIYEGITT